MKVKTIDNVTLQIFVSRGRRETIYYVPPGMNGEKFSAFKTRNVLTIKKLKDEEYGSTTKITKKEEECKPVQINIVPSQLDPQFTIQDHIKLQEREDIEGSAGDG